MKLNLGCGPDLKDGYVNADFRDIPGVTKVDLSKFPWPWPDDSVDQILMLDFLEHFPYRKTTTIIRECWRVLKLGGKLEVQVPDLEHCARAAAMTGPFLCNRCGWQYPMHDLRADFFICKQCRQPWTECAQAAIHRLYGGQDYEGNWHFTAFTTLQLNRMLQAHGFDEIQELEHEHQYKNWNFKFSATKVKDLWGDEP